MSRMSLTWAASTVEAQVRQMTPSRPFPHASRNPIRSTGCHLVSFRYCHYTRFTNFQTVRIQNTRASRVSSCNYPKGRKVSTMDSVLRTEDVLLLSTKFQGLAGLVALSGGQ
jgi:hypothetical protein